MPTSTMHYAGKEKSLAEIFGAQRVEVRPDAVVVDGRVHPVVDDVIVLLPPERRPARLRSLPADTVAPATPFAADVQDTFGAEWTAYDQVLPEHADEFRRYFDLVDLPSLAGHRVCDLGCGMGRWSHFLKDRCRELVLVDFSEAIFAARRTLRGADNAFFFMADIQALPFAQNFCDFLFCLGVLHHLPVPCLDVVRRLAPLSPDLLIFLYYALDNRPPHYRVLLALVTAARQGLCRVKSPRFRRLFSRLGALFLYRPLIGLGRLLNLAGKGSWAPLYDFYKDKSLGRIEQDVYDRFFTRIEQRVSRRQIEGLSDTFSQVTVSPNLPYWHFRVKH